MFAHLRTPKLLTLVPMLALGACVVAPEDGNVALGNPNASLNFQGFASAPGCNDRAQHPQQRTLASGENFATHDLEQFTHHLWWPSDVRLECQLAGHGQQRSRPLVPPDSDPAPWPRAPSTCRSWRSTAISRR